MTGSNSVTPRAGLLVVDFATGDLLFVAVKVEIVWEGEVVERMKGAKRVMVMRVGETIYLSGALTLGWDAAETPLLGDCLQAQH